MVSDNVCAMIPNKELIALPHIEEKINVCSELILNKSQTSPCVCAVRYIPFMYTWKYMLGKDRQEGISSNYEASH